MRKKLLIILLLLLLLVFASTAYAVEGGLTGDENEQVENDKETILTADGEEEPQERKMTSFERKIVEQGLRLLPEDHPVVLAYEFTYKIDIDTYKTTINGVELSGVPFEYGAKGNFKGFSKDWWQPTGNKEYPVKGLDCAGYIQWIYYQLGIDVPGSSSELFFAGKSGVSRKLPGIREHLVIPSLDDAMIGDIAYNSINYSYKSGHGSHSQMYLGTADMLGITDAMRQMMKKFPGDAHLVLDCGWSDGLYYSEFMKKIAIKNSRDSLGGVGVQFFSSIKQGDKEIYSSPYPKRQYGWKNSLTQHTYYIEARIEKEGRLMQYKPDYITAYPINLSRPVTRPDVK